MNSFDLIVIGGGAAGLMACASAIRNGKHVLLLEKNSKLGVKILMSGGTRCNITHHCNRQRIVEAFGKQGRFLHSALASLPPSEVVELIESQNVATKVEPGGKIFPVSNKAIDVRDALVRLATDCSFAGTCTILKSMACLDVTKQGDTFRIITQNEEFISKAVLITTGGKSYPGCGTTGDGYTWAQNFGHEIIDPVAALTPITIQDHWSNSLKGITFDDVGVQVMNPTTSGNIQRLNRFRGGFLFTHFGYSGPTVLNASREVSRSVKPDTFWLQCDFRPDLNFEQLQQQWQAELSAKPRQSISNVLAEQWPKRFVDHVLKFLEMNPSTKAAEFGKADLHRLLHWTKKAKFEIEGVYGFKKAEVTAGGVSLNQVDSRNMQSKICPGLFFAGEVLDLDGPIGGYNFQSAFSTGWLAGRSC